MIMIICTRRCKAGIMRDNASRESCFAVRDHECNFHCRMPTNFAPVTKLVRLSVCPLVCPSTRPSVNRFKSQNKHATQCPTGICKSLHHSPTKKEATDIMLQLPSFGSVQIFSLDFI